MKDTLKKILNISPYNIYAILIRLLSNKTKIVPSKMGFSILTPPTLRNSRDQIRNGSYEKYILENLEKNIDFRKSVIWDVGAHIGYHSFSFATHGAKVIAFEPNKNNIAIFEENTRMNSNLSNAITLYNIALSEKSGEIVFHTTGHSTGGYLEGTTPPLAKELYKDFREVVVKTKTVDELVKSGVPAPSAMKIDVEGGEARVLMGARKTLNEFHPVLVIEIHTITMMSVVQDFLKKHNYQISVIDGSTHTTTILAK